MHGVTNNFQCSNPRPDPDGPAADSIHRHFIGDPAVDALLVLHAPSLDGDVSRMAEALGVADPDPNTLFALTSSNPEWLALQPSAPPAAFSNNHLGYALTWFGLALALVGFYIVLLRRTLKQPRSASEAIGKEESS